VVVDMWRGVCSSCRCSCCCEGCRCCCQGARCRWRRTGAGRAADTGPWRKAAAGSRTAPGTSPVAHVGEMVRIIGWQTYTKAID